MPTATSAHRLIPYDPAWRRHWDNLVARARNGHFMFQRNYMEYHADRFADNSYLLLRGQKPVALLPAHRKEDTLVSHQGLSFGGWIMAQDCRYGCLEAGFLLLGEELRRQGLRRLSYTPAPYPYHCGGCGDDRFLLQKLGARCDQIKLAAFLEHPTKVTRNAEFRRRQKRDKEICPCEFHETSDVERFWDYLSRFLQARHGATPVHSVSEMRLLKERFPQNIRLTVARSGNDWVSGKLIFLTRQVTRYQYGFCSLEQPQVGWAFRHWEWLRQHPDFDRPWLDLGTSMQPGTNDLVNSLHLHKERFGARGVGVETWLWEP